MAETNNLKLALPTSNEYVDVEVLNENFRKIDTSILLALAAAAPYSAAATYAQGAYCTKDGKLYRCTVAILQAEAWNAAHWTATTVGAELVAIYTTLANKAPGGFGWGEAMKDVLASETEDTYETYCGKLDVLLADMPDGTSQRIYARGPNSTGQYYGAGNVVAVLSKILGTSASLIGLSPDPRDTTNGLWRMLKDNGKWQPVEWIGTLGSLYTLKSWTAEIAQNPGTKTFGSIQAVLLFPYDVTATGLMAVNLRSHLKQLVVIGWSLA